jgi:hypothetical protein
MRRTFQFHFHNAGSLRLGYARRSLMLTCVAKQIGMKSMKYMTWSHIPLKLQTVIHVLLYGKASSISGYSLVNKSNQSLGLSCVFEMKRKDRDDPEFPYKKSRFSIPRLIPYTDPPPGLIITTWPDHCSARFACPTNNGYYHTNDNRSMTIWIGNHRYYWNGKVNCTNNLVEIPDSPGHFIFSEIKSFDTLIYVIKPQSTSIEFGFQNTKLVTATNFMIDTTAGIIQGIVPHYGTNTIFIELSYSIWYIKRVNGVYQSITRYNTKWKTPTYDSMYNNLLHSFNGQICGMQLSDDGNTMGKFVILATETEILPVAHEFTDSPPDWLNTLRRKSTRCVCEPICHFYIQAGTHFGWIQSSSGYYRLADVYLRNFWDEVRGHFLDTGVRFE